MFQLTKDEATALRLQSAISKEGRGGRRYAPYVFAEQGVAMLSRVPRNQTAADLTTPQPKRPVGFRLPEDDK